ncbi:LysR family transcriptional regulator [Mesorhizobium sp. WSM4976]|uniref:LysR family transcriptional regulator n=1 Tax=Mesorhizobium sp. WSM4976 TaxID=3038549 RepID=UPI0024162475|nr:LysR family transcriptional regulator [Mesorhizobium sp. WSM4976]MDG4898569.1 LysR family transcriptional regulator [Mesorhizobium sp. WSM4976]
MALPISPFKGISEFLAVGETMNFTAAARQLGVTPAAIGQSIRNLEAKLSVQLFHRTTRKVRFTPAGQLLYDQVSPAAADVFDALTSVSNLGKGIGGVLKICVQTLALESTARPLIQRYRKAFPEIGIELAVRDGPGDILGLGYDIGIRLGEFLQPDMKALRVGKPISWVVAGSRAYFDRHGRPTMPEDLLEHRCIRYRWRGHESHYKWEFYRDRRKIVIDPNGVMTFEDHLSMAHFARNGEGLIYTYYDLTRGDIEAGNMECVLTEYMPEPDFLYVCYPSGRKDPRIAEFLNIARQRSALAL